MEPIAYYYLLGFGFLLLGVEILLFSFYLLWIGFGFIIVSLLSMMITFNNGLTQISLALIIGLVMLYFFKKPLQTIMKAQKKPERVVHKSGLGIVMDGSIKMNGTFWQTDDDLSAFNNGDKVDVIIESNKAKLSKKDQNSQKV